MNKQTELAFPAPVSPLIWSDNSVQSRSQAVNGCTYELELFSGQWEMDTVINGVKTTLATGIASRTKAKAVAVCHFEEQEREAT